MTERYKPRLQEVEDAEKGWHVAYQRMRSYSQQLHQDGLTEHQIEVNGAYQALRQTVAQYAADLDFAIFASPEVRALCEANEAARAAEFTPRTTETVVSDLL